MAKAMARGGGGEGEGEGGGKRELEISIPPFFTCPISLDLMNDPVSTCTGVTYDRASIEKWIDEGNNTCPATLQPLHTKELIPNHTLRRLIQAWCGANSAKGVERIPTPKTPANSHTVHCLFREIEAAHNPHRLRALQRLRALARDSVRNAICISDEGAADVLAGVLALDAADVAACVEAVGILAVLPLDEQAKKKISEAAVLAAVAGLLLHPDANVSAAELVERLTSDERIVVVMSAVDGLLTGLVKMVRDTAHTRAVKAGARALVAACTFQKNRTVAVAAGAVDGLVAVLMEPDRGLDETCLCLLESLCRCAEGRAAVAENALAVPVIVKKMSRSSPLATECAVGALWWVCCHCQSETVCLYAAESGVCTKLFWLLQVDCTHKAKAKAGDLIRLIHMTCRDCPCCYANACFDNAGLLRDDD